MIHEYLYNVTFDYWDKTSVLEPYVPYHAAPDEDRVTKRVCLAPSVEDCLTAMGDRTEMERGAFIRIRRVKISDLDPESIMTPEELAGDGRVPDALENREHWYLEDCPVESLLYKVERYFCEFAFAFTCISIDDIWGYVDDYFPGAPIKRHKDPESMYQEVVSYLYKNGMYQECDNFDDYIAELPWAQVLKVKDIKLRPVMEGVMST